MHSISLNTATKAFEVNITQFIFKETAPMHWPSILAINLIIFQTFFVTPITIAGTLDSAQNQPPGLITDPLIRITPDLLKRGLW
jgi:hypothetical protein